MSRSLALKHLIAEALAVPACDIEDASGELGQPGFTAVRAGLWALEAEDSAEDADGQQLYSLHLDLVTAEELKDAVRRMAQRVTEASHD